jgi:hypothetical protein
MKRLSFKNYLVFTATSRAFCKKVCVTASGLLAGFGLVDEGGDVFVELL